MTDAFTSALPLHQFPRETIPAAVELHHFGVFDATKHKLNRPLWVSDDYACALGYKNLGVPAPRYTKLVTATEFEIVNLNGFLLQPLVMQLNVRNHFEWNKVLAEHLSRSGILGLVYSGREIFLADPSKVINATEVHSAEAQSCGPPDAQSSPVR